VGIVGMSIGLRRGLRISCCRIIWFDLAGQNKGFNWGYQGYARGVEEWMWEREVWKGNGKREGWWNGVMIPFTEAGTWKVLLVFGAAADTETLLGSISA
jgi:hypothetical protein